MATPGEARPDVRSLLSQELDVIRSKIVQEKLVLFIGEQMSTLASTEDLVLERRFSGLPDVILGKS